MFIGIDIGGTNTRIVTSESLDNVVLKDVITFETNQIFESGLQMIVDTIKNFSAKIEAVGIGVPGSVSNEGFWMVRLI